jgi:hypothetical protein
MLDISRAIALHRTRRARLGHLEVFEILKMRAA